MDKVGSKFLVAFVGGKQKRWIGNQGLCARMFGIVGQISWIHREVSDSFHQSSVLMVNESTKWNELERKREQNLF